MVDISEMNIVNACGAIYEEDVLRQAICWLNPHVKKYNRVIRLKEGYPFIHLDGKDWKLHRLIGQYVYNDRTERYVYHHKDENKLNALSDNIIQMFRGDHVILHCKGRTISAEQKSAHSKFMQGNTYAKGHKWSDTSRKRLSQSVTGKPSTQRKIVQKISLSGIIVEEYESLTSAAINNNVCIATIANVIRGRRRTCRGHLFKYKNG